VKEVK
jgi:hypothetical protein